MSYLGLLLVFKIGVTFLFVSAPLLLGPNELLVRRTNTTVEAVPWLRLYGVAVTALLAGYGSGFWTLAEGRFPWGIVVMGAVSNTGASAVLIATGLARRTPFLTAAFVLIALGLLIAAGVPQLAATRVF
jgi:hypothetical protein